MYEGFKNRATWSVCLWVDKDYDMYKTRLDMTPQTAYACRVFCNLIFQDGKTPDDELLSNVDWNGVAEHWAEE